MKASILPFFSLALSATASPAVSPEIHASDLAPRAPQGLVEGLLGGVLSVTGSLIKDILGGVKSAQDGEISAKPLICLSAVDACCVWYDVSKTLTGLFRQPNGECNDAARAAVRLGFHDAGSWDKQATHGGADGSILKNFGEDTRPENNGLQSIIGILRGVQSKHNVGFADLVQYAHNHATVTCPRGPRIITFVGRKDATKAAPTGLLPDVHSPADDLIKLFEDKGFSPHDLAALVGAHSSAKQRFVDTSKANMPLDKTPGVWDVEFYNDTLQKTPPPNVFVLPSDKVLSVHPRVSDEWKDFVGDQQHWNEDYAKAYIKMSLLGVTNLNDLKLCTRTLPAAVPF